MGDKTEVGVGAAVIVGVGVMVGAGVAVGLGVKVGVLVGEGVVVGVGVGVFGNLFQTLTQSTRVSLGGEKVVESHWLPSQVMPLHIIP